MNKIKKYINFNLLQVITFIILFWTGYDLITYSFSFQLFEKMVNNPETIQIYIQIISIAAVVYSILFLLAFWIIAISFKFGNLKILQLFQILKMKHDGGIMIKYYNNPKTNFTDVAISLQGNYENLANVLCSNIANSEDFRAFFAPFLIGYLEEFTDLTKDESFNLVQLSLENIDNFFNKLKS